MCSKLFIVERMLLLHRNNRSSWPWGVFFEKGGFSPCNLQPLFIHSLFPCGNVTEGGWFVVIFVVSLGVLSARHDDYGEIVGGRRVIWICNEWFQGPLLSLLPLDAAGGELMSSPGPRSRCQTFPASFSSKILLWMSLKKRGQFKRGGSDPE